MTRLGKVGLSSEILVTFLGLLNFRFLGNDERVMLGSHIAQMTDTLEYLKGSHFELLFLLSLQFLHIVRFMHNLKIIGL